MKAKLTDAPLRFSWLAAAGFAALCFFLNAPGRLNADSLFLVIAATGAAEYNNWHSPTLGWLWGLPAPWLGQPGGALLIQALLFGVFAGFLPRAVDGARGGAALLGELLLRVLLAGTFGFVGKDAAGLATLLIAVQLVRYAVCAGWTGPRIAALVASLLLFLLVKTPNFVVLLVALALLLPFFRSPRRSAGWLAAALALGVLAIPLIRAVDRHVFAARDVRPDKQLVIFDLAGISLATGENAFARVPGWPIDLPPLGDCFLPYMWDAFAPWAPCRGYSAAYDRLDAGWQRRWLAEVTAHPLAYAGHRLRFTGHLLGSRDQDGWGADGAPINDARSAAARVALRDLMRGLHAREPIGLWRPGAALAPVGWLEARLFQFPKAQWVWLLSALAVLLSGWLRRHAGVRLGAILPAALAVGNVVMLALFGVADPARYLLPTMVLGCAALLALLAPPARR